VLKIVFIDSSWWVAYDWRWSWHWHLLYTWFALLSQSPRKR